MILKNVVAGLDSVWASGAAFLSFCLAFCMLHETAGWLSLSLIKSKLHSSQLVRWLVGHELALLVVETR
jgi:hypothetical protein